MRAASCPMGRTFDDLYRRAAVYVDKILKGAKPADLPPCSRRRSLNLSSTLRRQTVGYQIGLIIPGRVLERANQVIK